MARDASSDDYPAQAGSCVLSRWTGDTARCRWCDATARRASPWCGTGCEDEYRANHWWDLARSHALGRDQHRCVRCGVGPEEVTLAKLLLRALIPMGPVDAARLWRSEGWSALRLRCSVEVNHRWPRLGRGYGSGCHHHLADLETLCHPCHVRVTNGQAVERAAG